MISTDQMQMLKFPIGKFERPKVYTEAIISQAHQSIRDFPGHLRNKVESLAEDQLNWIYRPDGWSIRQVVHHCADSHMNAFIRFKLALTEDSPIIKPYDQAAWAMLEDSSTFPLHASLSILNGLHPRFAKLIASLTPQELDKTFTHPEWNKRLTLKMNVCLYAWHCDHHLAHIDNAIKFEGKFN